ncbi:MAG: FAD-dependent oxidoreductase [Candidatus Delongbacteria bacterium]|nr:FAD-dependent oxidoreductase [Candidatus Delongbacteria bacterium]MCG2761433.1 FAD-dependent oxidoreductase [Candidatus Delongbacteria bacterium]
MSLKDIISPFNAWKRAFEKPDTIVKPLSERDGADLYRGFHTNDIEKCIGCGSCEEICQNASIDLVDVASIQAKSGDSGLRPLIDYGRCCWCALCVDICPTGSLKMSNDYTWVTDDSDAFRFIPGVDKKKWDNSEKGYKSFKEAWLVNPNREHASEKAPDIRKHDFDEYAEGFSDEQALVEAGRCLECGICIQACPTHMDIPKYISAIRKGNLEEGLRIMYETNPMLEACGRICTAKCEDVCAVGHNGKPIAIRSLKRYIGDKTFRKKDEIMDLKPVQQTGKKVGIIGGGPAGLTAAFYLRRLGHAVTIYEQHDKLGGMLKWGIPDYRLPADVLQREIDFIIRQGIDVKYNVKIGKDISFDQLHKDNDAVFIGVGAQIGSDMPIRGMDTEGVYSGVEFLEKVSKGEKPFVGKYAVVVGGGNTSIDAARSSIRLGANAKILYRRTEQEMPANREEIREAKEEGADLMILSTPTKIEKLPSGGLKIECLKMELGEPDSSGRRRPVPKEGSEFYIEADVCIMAVGQKVEPEFSESIGLKVTKWGTFEVHSDTLRSNDKVFAGGDCQTGPDDAIRAVAAGKTAAYFIDKQFKG